ncbi:uncharacterized protein K444DRAFT_618740 [Hyaloscypha bicolor E]|uniref:Uncharacterized protein n=1 Tax=Hyaloscypha bicolor E TaxID=1095630 RepID=A0A2J6SU45_9HELO|nr:uncharacterized protein K444DRAFT_618740 [Hyaloscypha bicolor E]PMD54279.1 hypothetical protein K444DRAFT_618740 [Hyaloscypha bicolor E]
MIRVAIVAARRNKERFPLITASLDSKVATAPFPPIYHEHNHDSKHNLIDCIGILPRDDIYLPLAGSLLPIPTTYLYRAGRHYKGELRAMIYMFQRDLGGQSVAMFRLEPAQCSYFWDYLAHTQFQSEPPLPNLDPESFWGYPSLWLVPLPSLQSRLRRNYVHSPASLGIVVPFVQYQIGLRLGEGLLVPFSLKYL